MFVLPYSILVVDKFILKYPFFEDKGGDKAYIYGAWSAIGDLANIAAFFAAVYADSYELLGQNQEDFRKAVAKLFNILHY